MNTTNDKKTGMRFLIVTGLILLAVISRMIPHEYNLSPFGAIGLFGAAWFSKKWQAFVIPMAATFLSDLYLNNVVYKSLNPEFTVFYQGAYWQYIAYIAIICVGFLLFKSKVTAPKVLAGAVSATVIFFLISNFGTWFSMNMYPKTFAGLMTCYELAIPFIKGTLAGDLLYSGVLFGAYALIKRNVPSLRFA